MKILDILTDNEVTPKDKLKAINKLVKDVREVYGNGDMDIRPVRIPTVNGNVDISLLNKEEKVVIAEQEIRKCISTATAVTDNVEGSVFDKQFEYCVAVNPILVNIGKRSTSRY